ncbi:MAG: PEP-CTERM sorting domain-containing protein [Pseudomonadota bacterium]|nr:PEP-CTERM sorting domain-containing protein [Pseudomonadota bacterium]
MKTLTTVLLLTLVSSAAIAGIDYQPPVSVPEPGILGLFATAGVTLFLARKFRK